jgi:hypothetical protein
MDSMSRVSSKRASFRIGGGGRSNPANKKLDELYPWDTFWDYMLDDSELDDTSRASMMFWKNQRREAARLAAIRQEIRKFGERPIRYTL